MKTILKKAGELFKEFILGFDYLYQEGSFLGGNRSLPPQKDDKCHTCPHFPTNKKD